MFLCQLCVIWNVASHLPLNLSSPQSWGTPHLLACLWRSAAALDFSSWTLIKLWGFCLFDWWSSKFHEDCISYFLLLLLNPVTKNQSKNESSFVSDLIITCVQCVRFCSVILWRECLRKFYTYIYGISIPIWNYSLAEKLV